MIICGLTGGICCGKSTVSKTLMQHFPIVDADLVARKVVEPGSEGLRSLVKVFGEEILMEDGTLHRTKLGKIAFDNQRLLQALNIIMGPLIENESKKQLQSYKDKSKIVIYDAALIIESGHADLYRPLIVVHCLRETQINRLMSRNSLTEQDAMARINAQMISEEKIKYADYTIDTNGTVEESIKQTNNIINKLNSLQTN